MLHFEDFLQAVDKRKVHFSTKIEKDHIVPFMDILPQYYSVCTRKSASQIKEWLLGVRFSEIYSGKLHIKIQRKLRKKEKTSNEIKQCW